MNVSRRDFLSFVGAGAAAAALPGCCSFYKCCGGSNPKIALQLYSLRNYIGGVKDKDGKVLTPGVGLEKALADVAKIGYKGVEFAGYYNFKASELKKMLDDNGLVACGTHVGREAFSPEKIKETCEFNLGYGNKFICCPGGGNMPPNCNWKGEGTVDKAWMDQLCDYYNQAAETAKQYGCIIGLHNHQWEFQLKLADGTTYWDYFFSHTSKDVQMEQDVGWTTCSGNNPCEQFKKYPGRSFTLHAKENGMGAGVTKFDAILGKPGEPGAVGVDWDGVIAAARQDGVKWFVVECERHFEDLSAVTPSYAFLKSKGLD